MRTMCGKFSLNVGDRKEKKQLILCVLIVILLSSALATPTSVNPEEEAKPKYSRVTKITSCPSSIAEVCRSTTLYPEACVTAFASASATSSPAQLFHVSVQSALGQARAAGSLAYNLTLRISGQRESRSSSRSGVDDCVELLDITMNQLKDVLDPAKTSSSHDVRTWLSAALTNQVTCTESLLMVTESEGKDSLNAQVKKLSEFVSNSLALYKDVTVANAGVGGGGRGRKLLNDDAVGGRFPTWVAAGDRRLLEASPGEIRADAVVAQDGSGTHRTIGEAIAFVSLASSGGRSVIYVKAGTYSEHVNIPTKQKNVMLMGDGKGKSVIVGSRNAGDGSSTYATATVAAMGAGFIAKGLTIINKAGPSGHQAVALRVGADQSVIYQCSIEGYQDTLYTHSNRQFYSQDDIYGTVDFIFGNSVAVFQNCFIQPRKPGSGQSNSITAQGRTDPNQNTGISIHKCKIQGAAELGHTPTYLGRPWQKYSRTVFMGSYLDGSINQAGWEKWSGNFALSTLYYGEYGNTGPGAATSARVRWAGVHPSMSVSEATKFTVGEFIYGDSWLSDSGVSYTSGL